MKPILFLAMTTSSSIDAAGALPAALSKAALADQACQQYFEKQAQVQRVNQGDGDLAFEQIRGNKKMAQRVSRAVAACFILFRASLFFSGFRIPFAWGFAFP